MNWRKYFLPLKFTTSLNSKWRMKINSGELNNFDKVCESFELTLEIGDPRPFWRMEVKLERGMVWPRFEPCWKSWGSNGVTFRSQPQSEKMTPTDFDEKIKCTGVVGEILLKTADLCFDYRIWRKKGSCHHATFALKYKDNRIKMYINKFSSYFWMILITKPCLNDDGLVACFIIYSIWMVASKELINAYFGIK